MGSETATIRPAELAEVPDLTKWPRLLVAGEAVTEDQAAEIIVRTDHWWVSTNDRAFEAAIYDLIGVDTDEHGTPRWHDLEPFRRSIAALSLEYLANSQIVSPWVGGPHGWVDWAGQVGCSTWNIGKWPTIEEVYDEWALIAQTWPFLTLSSQLVTNEGEGTIAVQFDVADGQVVVTPRPERQIAVVREAPFTVLFGREAERGCTIERLSSAVEIARENGSTREVTDG